MKLPLPLLLAALTAMTAALTGSADDSAARGLKINTDLREFKLPAIDGDMVQPLSPASDATRGIVCIFALCDCPIANAYSPEISRIASEYKKRNFDFYFVHTDPATTIEKARKHARDYALDLKVVLDPEHRLVRFLKAETVPEAFVLTPDLKTAYRGRIDDRNTAYGKRRAEPTRRDLREALDAIIAGKPVPNPKTPVIGCYIPPLPEK